MSSMMDLINSIWKYERNIVSDGYDQALNRLAEEMPMTTHRYPTGEPCWTWKIPEKWTCDEAYLETMDGKRIIDKRDHPLHVVSYSLPYEGIVKRDDLLPHLFTHKSLPEAIPFVFKYYDRDWGLCLSDNQKATLSDDQYKVVIKSRFESGELKVGEVIVPGKSSKCFVFVAHLCHPHMVDDDLTGVVVGLDVMKALQKLPTLEFTYRFLILPETIGSVAYLSHNENLIPEMRGGMFLEILGNDQPLAFQHSIDKTNQADKVLWHALKGLDPSALQGDYRHVIDNDERQFNSPGVRVPMVSLSRVIPDKSSPKWPFFGYHSNFDNPDQIAEEQLVAARDVVLGLINAWEHNYYVINKFKGEIFCSGYKIWIDHTVNPEGHRRLFEIMERCDGSRTVADIASELDISFQSAWEVIELLYEKDLVSLSRFPQPTTPKREN
jgi:aminopeptidase-like protein